MQTAEGIIRQLDLIPHPEGGHYRETFRDPRLIDGRPASSAIYYLLARNEKSHWHRVDAVEVWHWYAGEALQISISEDGKTRRLVLGNDLDAGQMPQVIVPAFAWQAARPLGVWTLVGCTVAPAFEFTAFEMAAPDWAP